MCFIENVVCYLSSILFHFISVYKTVWVYVFCIESCQDVISDYWQFQNYPLLYREGIILISSLSLNVVDMISIQNKKRLQTTQHSVNVALTHPFATKSLPHPVHHEQDTFPVVHIQGVFRVTGTGYSRSIPPDFWQQTISDRYQSTWILTLFFCICDEYCLCSPFSIYCHFEVRDLW